MNPISHTDLILNPDGSIYHLHLLPGDIADHVILVGDPGRVKQVSSHFDHIELEKSNREFVTHTGSYKGKRITALSTGIGTDNIDIVLNELDALVNVNLEQRTIKSEHRSLKLIRIGTSGALHADIAPGEQIIARIAGGFDGLYHFYKDPDRFNMEALAKSFMDHSGWEKSLAEPYFIKGSEYLHTLLSGPDLIAGITLSTPGFYAPQQRSIRLKPFDPELISKIGTFRFEGMRINNFEMESSALYALSALLNHQAITICVAIANRISLEFLESYHGAVDELITMVLDKLAQDD
ncbi:MAG: phosphorylase [Bacteroidetes bacterium]|nr:MAG: phosphorylase [Bacteroidota bacterium]RLD90165.1 MAG: phosphorylase [Bacteroidota bacterium]